MTCACACLFAVLHAHVVVAPQPGQSVLSVAHSHNDYEQSRPLALALEAGFESVEADVLLRGREVVVSHGFFDFADRGSLDDLYLKPLQERVDRLGSVHGDGRPFYLWIDLKESSRELTDALHALLMRYPMFSVFTDERVYPRPVVAILTGDEDAKRRYTDEHVLRRACRDSNRFDANDPGADRRWTWYALRWDELTRGSSFTEEEGLHDVEHDLRRKVERVHATGRRLRVYAMPERAEAWEAAIAAGVDLVGTDRIETFAAFLRARAVRVASPAAPSTPDRAAIAGLNGGNLRVR
jgi:hypothetical protein